jgi:chorismate synthase
LRKRSWRERHGIEVVAWVSAVSNIEAAMVDMAAITRDGEPIFDKLEADLAKAMLSIPATKGFEIGSGFEGTLLTGREHNDPYRMVDGKVRTTSNRSGGVQGGISNGEHILFRVAFKPTATMAMAALVLVDGALRQAARRAGSAQP